MSPNKWITNIPTIKFEPLNKDVIRLDLNENPYPPSPKVIECLSVALKGLNRYPRGDIVEEAKFKLAKYCNVSPENIYICNGSDVLVYTLMEALLNEGDRVLTFKPTFVSYVFAAKRMGANVEYINLNPDNMFKPDFNEVVEKIKDKKMFILSNPNNPTGNILLEPGQVEEILQRYPDVIVVVDEAYYEFSNVTVANLVKDYSNLIVLRTFSKAFSLAGLRVGYSISSSEVVDYLMKVHGPFPVTSLAYYAIIGALDDLEYMKVIVRKIIVERERVYNELSHINGVKVLPSKTNFLLFHCNIEKLADKLLHYKVAIRDFSRAIGNYYYRVCTGLPKENTAFIEALKSIIK